MIEHMSQDKVDIKMALHMKCNATTSAPVNVSISRVEKESPYPLYNT